MMKTGHVVMLDFVARIVCHFTTHVMLARAPRICISCSVKRIEILLTQIGPHQHRPHHYIFPPWLRARQPPVHVAVHGSYITSGTKQAQILHLSSSRAVISMTRSDWIIGLRKPAGCRRTAHVRMML